MTTFLFALIFIGLIGMGFGFGMFVERMSWNKLIQEGKLPRPGQHHSATQQ